MNSREQYLQQRCRMLEQSLQSLEMELNLACLIIERVESVANAFAFDMALEGGHDFVVGSTMARWAEAQEKARAGR